MCHFGAIIFVIFRNIGEQIHTSEIENTNSILSCDLFNGKMFKEEDQNASTIPKMALV